MAKQASFSHLGRLLVFSNSLYLTMAILAGPLQAQQDIKVSTSNSLVSVQASNITAGELAAVLADELGISVVVTGDAETRVNVDIIEEPLDKALTKLSPNNMLVRSDNRPDSDIIEVVLMMGEGESADTGSDQFLPSGSPAEDLTPPPAPETAIGSDGAPLRDPNREAMVIEAGNSEALDAGGQPLDLPVQHLSDESIDPATGLPIDPMTGQPIQPQ